MKKIAVWMTLCVAALSAPLFAGAYSADPAKTSGGPDLTAAAAPKPSCAVGSSTPMHMSAGGKQLALLYENKVWVFATGSDSELAMEPKSFPGEKIIGVRATAQRVVTWSSDDKGKKATPLPIGGTNCGTDHECQVALSLPLEWTVTPGDGNPIVEWVPHKESGHSFFALVLFKDGSVRFGEANGSGKLNFDDMVDPLSKKASESGMIALASSGDTRASLGASMLMLDRTGRVYAWDSMSRKAELVPNTGSGKDHLPVRGIAQAEGFSLLLAAGNAYVIGRNPETGRMVDIPTALGPPATDVAGKAPVQIAANRTRAFFLYSDGSVATIAANYESDEAAGRWTWLPRVPGSSSGAK